MAAAAQTAGAVESTGSSSSTPWVPELNLRVEIVEPEELPRDAYAP